MVRTVAGAVDEGVLSCCLCSVGGLGALVFSRVLARVLAWSSCPPWALAAAPVVASVRLGVVLVFRPSGSRSPLFPLGALGVV